MILYVFSTFFSFILFLGFSNNMNISTVFLYLGDRILYVFFFYLIYSFVMILALRVIYSLFFIDNNKKDVSSE